MSVPVSALDSAAATLTADEELHWLALRLVPGLGTRRAVQLLDTLRSPVAIFRASRTELQAHGLSGSVAQSIASGCVFDDAADQQNFLREAHARLIPITSAAYPERLRQIYDPPPVLFVRGRLELLNSPAIAIVGTRNPTPYGKAAADRLSGDLAKAGLAIISGMARGIDTSAHQAALAVGGDTIAVFGCGVDMVYPTENRKLAIEIAEKGLLISEFPMRTPGYPQNFPIRNRIVSGMSVGVLVVEGAQYSGSAITARLAIDQGRDVFAVPGNITSKASWGPNLLIKQGAKLVQEWNDVVVDLDTDVRMLLVNRFREEIEAAGPAPGPQLPDGPMGETCRVLLRQLKPDVPVQLDNLIESLELHSSSEIIAALFELELLGMVKQLPGKNFVAVWANG